MKFFSFTLIFILSLKIVSFAQAQFSASTQFLENIVEKKIEAKSFNNNELLFSESDTKNYVIRKMDNTHVTGALLQVNNEIDESALLSLGIKINSKIGNIWTAVIPVTALPQLRQVNGLLFVDIDKPVQKRLDAARIDTRTALVHGGTGLPKAYKGEGVILGIIDSGFDFTHPTFRSSADNLRIVRVWEQSADVGTPPAGFNYGTELTNQADILEAEGSSDAEEDSHGTHVAGIAGGSGFLTNGVYTGIAPESELVFSTYLGANSTIADAANYIFSYAQSVSKPAVINMSLGQHIGPHDGTSLLDQAFDQLVGPGKILVGAAGNEGANKLHLLAELNNTTVLTHAEFQGENPLQGEGRVETWGDVGTEYQISVSFLNAGTGINWSSPFVSSNNSGVFEYHLIQNNDTLAGAEFSVVHNAAHNQKSNILISLRANVEAAAILTITGNGSVHLWNDGTGMGANFTDLDGEEGFVAGDSLFTVGEIGGTSNSVITVGAHSSKITYTNANGNSVNIPWFTTMGNIAPFSSVGPTADMRVKPNITAPGNVVVSSVSRFDNTLDPEEKVSSITIGNDEWWFSSQQGTSMASPVVAGAVALMLEVNPQLTYQDVLSIFKHVGRKDSFTGPISGEGSMTWGFGKIDIHQAVSATVSSVDKLDLTPSGGFVLQQNYPNPFNPVSKINYEIPSQAFVSLKVYDLLGREISELVNIEQEAGVYSVTFDASQLSSGIYFYTLQAGSFIETKKMTVLR